MCRFLNLATPIESGKFIVPIFSGMTSEFVYLEHGANTCVYNSINYLKTSDNHKFIDQCAK